MNVWWLIGGYGAYKWIKPDKKQVPVQIKVGIYRDSKGNIFYKPE